MKTNRQKGFLTILSVILVVLIALLGRYLLELGTTTSRSVYETHLNRQALHIAHAVLKLGEHKVKEKGVDFLPQTFTGKYPFDATTNFDGNYTLNIEKYNLTSRLASSLSETATTLTLDNATGFAPYGTLLIDQEIIWYQQIERQKLLKLKRGMFGTVAAGHTSGTSVTQNCHLLTATVYLPTESNYQCKKVATSLITWKGSQAVSVSNNITGACLVSGGKITVGKYEQFSWGGYIAPGHIEITNHDQPTGSNPYPPTITTGSGIYAQYQNSGLHTFTGPNHKPTSNTGNHGNFILKEDVSTNYSTITDPQKLWNSFFNFEQSGTVAAQREGYVKITAPGGITANQLHANKIWLQGPTTITFDNQSIGTPDHPKAIIVNGDLEIYGNGSLYGSIYATGNIFFHGGGNLTINGMMIAEKTTTIAGSLRIIRDNLVMQNLGWQATSSNGSATGHPLRFENLSSD